MDFVAVILRNGSQSWRKSCHFKDIHYRKGRFVDICFNENIDFRNNIFFENSNLVCCSGFNLLLPCPHYFTIYLL